MKILYAAIYIAFIFILSLLLFSVFGDKGAVKYVIYGLDGFITIAFFSYLIRK